MKRKTIGTEMVGFSVSLCIKNILDGKVDEKDVKVLFAGTNWRSKADLKQVIDSYSETYWRKNPKKAKAILNRLIAAGKIIQARAFGFDACNIAHNYWYPYLSFEREMYDFFNTIERKKKAIDGV